MVVWKLMPTGNTEGSGKTGKSEWRRDNDEIPKYLGYVVKLSAFVL